MAYDNIDYSAKIADLIANGASARDVQDALNSREEKIAADSSLSQYSRDQTFQNAMNYIGSNKNDFSYSDTNSKQGATPKTTTTPTNSYQSMYDQLYETQRRQQIAALKSAFESATGGLKTSLNSNLAGLDTAQAGIGDAYQVKRNQTAAQSDVGAMNFAQYMAARGIKGSAGGMPEIYRNSALQGSLGALNQAEARENADIDRQRATLRENFNTQLDTLNNKFLSDSTAVGAQIDAAATKSKIDAMKEDSAKATAQTAADKEAWVDTLGAYSDNYQAEIDRLQGLVDSGDNSQAWKIPYLRAARQSKIASQEQAQSAANQQQFENDLALQKLEQSRQSASSGGSGGSSSSKSKTYTQLDSDMQDIRSRNVDINGNLTPKGEAALYNYAITYAGADAKQLLDKYQVTGVGTGGGAPKGGGYNSVYNEAYTSMGEPGTTQEDIANYLKSQYEQGNVTRDEVLDIARRLNLNIS